MNNKEILEILTADDSGDESDIALDEEDQTFPECDLDNATEFILEGQNVQENIFETDAAIVEEPFQKRPKKMSKYNENYFKSRKLHEISQMQEVGYPISIW